MSAAAGAGVAALFPGQGSATPGMARAFFDASPAARDVLEQAESAMPGLLALMFEGPADALQRTAQQQPALVAAGASAYAAWREAGGPEPVCAAGHSLGEFTAHVAAGALSVTDAVLLVHRRGRYMQEAVPEGQGAMFAILKVSADEVRAALGEVDGIAEIANLNAPGQTVISGEATAVAAAAEALKARGARAMPLKVSAPFHCSLMRPAAERLTVDLAEVDFAAGAFPVVSNVDADAVGAAGEIAGLLQAQVTSPVRWAESMTRLRDLGGARFVEFGSGKVLTNLTRRILDDAEAFAVTDPDTLKEALP